MSGLTEVLARDAKGYGGRQMMLYGDQGYQNSAVMLTPYPGVNLGEDQACFNRLMASVRIAVEHEFGRLRNILRMTQYKGKSSPCLYVGLFTSIDYSTSVGWP